MGEDNLEQVIEHSRLISLRITPVFMPFSFWWPLHPERLLQLPSRWKSIGVYVHSILASGVWQMHERISYEILALLL